MLSALAAALGALNSPRLTSNESQIVDTPAKLSRGAESATDQAFDARANATQFEGHGVVFKILRDDEKGSRHQRFLVRLSSGLTILIAHNIDIAPRIDQLQVGDPVEFNGEYAWNQKGGVVHWTHRDPAGQHPTGWLRYRGVTYQ